MGEKVIFIFLSCVFFLLYFKLLDYVFNEMVPLSPAADVAAMWILFIGILPLSVFSADKVIKIIKNS